MRDDGRFFARAIETGGHLNSLAAVREGRADVCAIDCVCVALARRYRPEALEGLVEIARSPAVPGLPGSRAPATGRIREGLRRPSPTLISGRRATRCCSQASPCSMPGDYGRITGLEAEMETGGRPALL